MQETGIPKTWRRGTSLQGLPATVWRLQQVVRDYPHSPGWAYDAIGTLLAHYHQPDAETWLRKAIVAYQGMYDTTFPSPKIALVWWKAGQHQEFEAECVAVLNHSYRPSEPDGPGDSTYDRKEAVELGFKAEASFLLGRYEAARDLAEAYVALADRRIAKQGYGGRGISAMAIREMSSSILDGDRQAFQLGLDRLTTQIEEWPTERASVPEDLFRYCLSLPICDAQAFIQWKMEVDDGPPA